MSSFALTRRAALKTFALGASSLLLPRISRGQHQTVRSPDAMRLGFVGVGGQGLGAVEFLTDHSYVAFADVDDVSAAKAYAAFPNVPRYRDFRKMLDAHAKSIDAVVICTPDHSHFPIAMACMAAGKHVYIEKPLAPTPWECREMAEAARRHRVKAQLGIQGHSTSSLRMLREWVEAGAAGRIHSVHLWTDRMQPYRYRWSTELAVEEPVPPTLDWDLWLAGRPRRPYNHEYVPNRWRNWWDLGTGPIGDIGAHMFDVAEYSLGLGYPEWVEAKTPAISEFTAPPWTTAQWHFPARGERGPIDLFWSNGTRDDVQVKPAEIERVPMEVLAEIKNGVAFVGTEGTLLVDDMRASARPRLYPLEREREFLQNQPPRKYPRVIGSHFDDLFDAIRNGTEPGANLDYGGPLTEVVLLGTMSQRTGRRIYWDPETRAPREIDPSSILIRPQVDPAWIVR